ncbi:MAG: hypothetical protein R3D83_03780 [Caenibius sp.]
MAMTRNPDVRDVLNQVVKDPRYAEVMRVPLFSVPQLALVFLSLGLFGLASWGYITGQIRSGWRCRPIFWRSILPSHRCMIHRTARYPATSC